jgi:hypothetical protein
MEGLMRVGSRTLMLALRAWLEGDSRGGGEMRARRLAELIIAKALAGHFGYFRHLIDRVDGRLRPTAEEEWTAEPDCRLAVADVREIEPAEAA